jgi:hypothetical protein
MATQKQRRQAEAVDTLKQWGVVDGTTVYAKVNNVSASGMHRRISLYCVLDGGRIVDISYHAAHALDWSYKDRYNGGIGVSGCGMDMLFATIDALSHAMGYGSICQQQDAKPERKRIGWDKKTEQPIYAERIGLKYRGL